MKNRLIYIGAILILLSFFSCSDQIIPGGTEITRRDSVRSDSSDYKEQLQKTKITRPGDSSSFRVVFGCDSLKNAFIKQIEDLKSRGVITEFVFKDNTLYFSTMREQLEDSVMTLQTKLRVVSNKSVREYVYVQKPPIILVQNSKFAKFCTWWFIVTVAVLAGMLIKKFNIHGLILKMFIK